MIESIVLIISLLLFLMVVVVVGRSMIKKQRIVGHPPVPMFYFILAKGLVVVNLVFLVLKGLKTDVCRVFIPGLFLDLIALGFLVTGAIIVFLSTIQLNDDLIFGLPGSGKHKLHTKGLFSRSRHPFYLGFLFILFSSCLFNPNIINIVSFIGVWLIHHVIMIREEEFLGLEYGDEYSQYIKKVNRYITF